MLSNSINWLIECKKARTSRQPPSCTWQPSWPGGFEQMCLSVELWQDSQSRVGTKTKLMFELTMLAVKHTFKKPLKWRATKSYHVDPSQPTVHLCIILTKVADIIGATPPHNRNSCMCAHIDSYHGNFYWVMLQKGGNVMVGMRLRVELKRLQRWCLCFFYIFWSSQTTLHRETKSGLFLTFDPHIPIILIVYSISGLPHLFRHVIK